MSVPGASSTLSFIDHSETYGPRIIQEMVSGIKCDSAVDIGCGHGRDLKIIKSIHPSARLVGIDFGEWNRESLGKEGIELHESNIEKDELPIADSSVDVIIANQVFEHVKEIFWVNHQIAKKLKIGGHFILGVPNICSFHNRLLMLLGGHPTQWKSYSAHVRPFSKRDAINFYRYTCPALYKLSKFRGAQFYPFPKRVSRAFCSLAPNLAFSIFFLFRKERDYKDEIIQYPALAQLETNYYVGITSNTSLDMKTPVPGVGQ